MQSTLCSFSVPPAHRNWLIAVLSCFSYLTGMLSFDPTKLIIGSNCAFIMFEQPTSVRQRCFQLLVNVFILSTTPSQFFWLISACFRHKCIPVIFIVCFTGIPLASCGNKYYGTNCIYAVPTSLLIAPGLGTIQYLFYLIGELSKG
jgi:hypothetical protein